jgi:hypothetical protein
MSHVTDPASTSRIKSQSGLAADDGPVREAQFEIVKEQKRGRGGRPRRLTEARFNRILAHIRKGLTIVSAVSIESITYDCWRKRLRQSPEWQKLVDEAEETREEIWRCEALECVRAAFGKNWQSAMCFLERRWPDRYSSRAVNRSVAANDAVLDKISPDQLAADIQLAREIAEKDRPATNLNLLT